MRIMQIISLAALGAGMALCAPVHAEGSNMRNAQGQAFWDEDPGPVTDPYWTQGAYKFDPYGYGNRNWPDPEYEPMTVFGDHSGKANCVFRKRVQITSFDFRHPIIRVCRRPPSDWPR